jgi:DNA-binding beta-propeller fold protein YncE
MFNKKFFLITLLIVIFFILGFDNNKNFLNNNVANGKQIPDQKLANEIFQAQITIEGNKIKQREVNKITRKVSDPNVNFNVKTLPGQLVSHLFDVKNLPAPKAVKFSPDGSEIWVTHLLNKTKGVTVLNAISGKKVAEINLDKGGGVEIVFSPDGKKAFVSQMETAKVYEIDTQTKEISRVLSTKSSWTKVLIVSKDGRFLYASNWSGNNVTEINLTEGKVKRQIQTVKTPRGLYLTEDGRFLYVAGFDRGEIQKIDLETGKKKVIFKSGGAARHIVGDEERKILFVSDMGKNVVWKVNMKNDSVEKFVDTDNNPNTIVLSNDKKILIVSCRGKNYSADNYSRPGPEWGSVLLFDAETGEKLDAIIGGNQPTGLDISPDGKILAFSDFLDGKLEVFGVPTFEVLKMGGGGRSKIYKKELKK